MKTRNTGKGFGNNFSGKNLGNILVLSLVIFLSLTVCIGEVQAQVAGPRYHANIQLQDGTDILPPGAGINTEIVVVDTGSPVTILNRTQAKQFGLLNATGHSTGLHVGTASIGGATGGAMRVYVSKNLTIKIKGKYFNLTDKDKNWTNATNISVVYPMPGQMDLPVCLLGTNVLSKTGAKIQPEDGIKINYSYCPSPYSKVTTVTGEQDRQIIEDITVNGVSGDFYVATGSKYTIINQSLATTIGLDPIDTFDMYNLDNETFTILSFDGFFDVTDTEPFDVVETNNIAIPAFEGDNVAFKDKHILINPNSSSNKNLIATDLLTGPCDGDVIFNDTTIVFYSECKEVSSITPLSFLLALVSLLGLGAIVMRNVYKR